eukprot:2220927-Rhodomonas_salina.1
MLKKRDVVCRCLAGHEKVVEICTGSCTVEKCPKRHKVSPAEGDAESVSRKDTGKPRQRRH